MVEHNPTCYCCSALPKVQHRIGKLEMELRDAVVLLATANPGEDLPDQEAADLWSEAVCKFLLKNQHLVGSTSIKETK